MVAFEDSDRQDDSTPPDSPHVKKFRKELSSGLIALVLLALLARARGEMYGYEIAKTLGQAVGDAPQFKQSALYPVLRSLHAAGLLESRVQVSESGPPRRYYRISQEGEAALAAWTATWRGMRSFVDAILDENSP